MAQHLQIEFQNKTSDMKLIDNNHTRLLSKAMDAYALRQRMTSMNVANMDTPDYKRVQVNFEDELQKAELRGVSGQDLSKVNPTITETENAPVLEDEMMDLADTQIRVQLVTRALRHNFQMLRTSITGRNL